MSITFDITDHYVHVAYIGLITDAVFLSAWMSFYESDQWIPGMNVLNDMSNADVSATTTKGIRTAVDYDKIFHNKHGIPFKVAHYVPGALQYGLARAYNAISDDTPFTSKLFQDIQKAMDWLKLDD